MKKHPSLFNTACSMLIIVFLVIISLVTLINLYQSPQTIWFVYPAFVLLWWPLTMFLTWFNKHRKTGH